MDSSLISVVTWSHNCTFTQLQNYHQQRQRQQQQQLLLLLVYKQSLFEYSLKIIHNLLIIKVVVCFNYVFLLICQNAIAPINMQNYILSFLKSHEDEKKSK